LVVIVQADWNAPGWY
nr:Chain A, lasso peptide [Streptomyces sp.]